MKTKKLAIAACTVLGILALLGGCDSAGSDGGDVSYTVSFTLEGTDYVLTEGYTAEDVFDAGANGSLSDGGGFIRIAAVDASVSDMGTEGPHILLSISGNSSGTYTTEANISIFIGSDVYHSTSDTGPDPREIRITFPDEVGGVIEGTFSGTLSGGNGPVEVENGVFVAERLEDGTVEVPSWWK